MFFIFALVASAFANTPGVACEFFTMPMTGCGPDRDENVANCVVVENPTKYYAEVGIKGICPVGSGTAVIRPIDGLPTYIDGAPADPTVGARNVAPPHSTVYVFLRPSASNPYWEPPRYISVEARLYSQVTAVSVTNAQFVPGYTDLAWPVQGGPVGAGYFCQELDLLGPYSKATIRRNNYCR